MTEDTSQQAMEDIPQIAPFDPTKKKKKKKKKVIIQHHVDNSLYSSVEREDMLPLIEGRRNVFLGLTKEKTSVGTSTLLDDDNDAAGVLRVDSGELNEEEDALVRQSRYPWEESERDYEYNELVQRVFGFLHENNPELAGDRRRTVLRPLKVLPEGSSKTVFLNLMDLCKTMHRLPQHVITFMLTELGTSGLLDGENRLVVRGRFATKSLEVVLQKYINEYVLCHICRTPDTILLKENHILLLQCELCGSERSVAPIAASS